MGWLAVGICTAVAALGFYSIISKRLRNDEETQEAPIKTEGISHIKSASISGGANEKRAVQPTTNPQIAVKVPSVDVTIAPADTSLQTAVKEHTANSSVNAPGLLATSIPQRPANMAPPPPRSLSPPRLKPPTFSSMPAPPRPSNGTVRPPPSAASSLRVPSTKILSNTSMAPYSLSVPKGKASRQVVLQPGHSPMDWAALIKNPNNRLRGKDAPLNLTRISPSQLKQQTGRKGKDAWTVYQGKVYNITSYLAFHPGGEPELMKGAGRDSGKLFQETHPWVNWDGILSECLVGILVTEDEAVKASEESQNHLDEMD